MQMEIYTDPSDIESFKNYGKILVFSYDSGNNVKLWIDIKDVIISRPNDAEGTLWIQRYTPSQGTGPKS